MNDELPVLYHKGKGGELRSWCVFVKGDTIFTEHGHVGGALQVTTGKKATLKNVGRSNEYGTSTGGRIIATSKSGTDQFHGAAFEYLRNKSLNALQFTNTPRPGDQRPKDNENRFGFNIGGPAKILYAPFI